ncbi:restriction endonuclease [Microbacterium sp. NEAU-LLC]|uniref:Restriction endonuclease n=1 Tax=Microbacterium helvum TaxID=2773713 RepID=A0ABR8NQ37_9MICO|nr:restriction endonuclease [Microbacterium helvum]MBD3942118.1 restriction endonuclease [Microbacterium helvum]
MSDPAARASIPKWHEFIDPVFRVLADEPSLTLQQIYDRVADRVGLSDAAKAEVTPSARQPVYWNRIGWAVSRSKGAGLLEQPARAVYSLTVEGRSRARADERVDESTLRQYPAYIEWIASFRKDRRAAASDSVSPGDVVEALDDERTPEDQIEDAVKLLTRQLEEQVYELLHQVQNPYYFEDLVTRFIAALGYGDDYEVTARSGDLGIDGVVWRDKLGLERVYIQAKRYAEGNTVSAEAVRAFIGSLGLHRASVGVMITTSTFPKTSHEEVARTHSTNVRLIEGRELAKLMVKHGVGVTVERQIPIRRIDTDVFIGDPLML